MELRVERDSDVDNWKEVILIYNSALKQISTKLEILNDEFQHVHRYNPIEHIKDIRVFSVKDYIVKPKESGYKSYHMLVTVPVYLSDRIVDTKVEIQIRTVAMDFWASLEHKIHYKFEGNAPEHIKDELVECAKIVSELDDRMLSLNEQVLQVQHK